MSAQDEIYTLRQEFEADPRTSKVNGGIGVYLNTLGKPFVMPVAKQAVKYLNLSSFNYLPIAGSRIFLDETAQLILGPRLYHRFNNRLARQGVAGGTNGLFTWGLMIKETVTRPQIIIDQPSWGNHHQIFSYLKFDIIHYPYLTSDYQFNLPALEATLSRHPRASLLLQTGFTHNPTGVSPTHPQWLRLIQLLKRHSRPVLIDSAYLGLGKDIVADAQIIRLFATAQIPISVVVSFSKNMTLYQHRSGALLTLAPAAKTAQKLETMYQFIFRVSVSNPPALGELIAEAILTHPSLKTSWVRSLRGIVTDITNRRRLFAHHAGEKFSFLKHQTGFYSLLRLTETQVKLLKSRYGIYLLSNSRINFGGLSLTDIPKVARAVLKVTTVK